MALNNINSSDIHRVEHPESFVTLMGSHFVDPLVSD